MKRRNQKKERKELTLIRCYPSERDRILKAAREISVLEERDIRTPELIRRITNIPNIKEILLDDARLKRKLQGGDK